MLKEIEYYPITKEYFKKFLQPTKEDNENLLKYYDKYENDIKSFVEKELCWYINIYYARIVNASFNKIEWFYVIDNGTSFFSSDDYEICRISSYEFALNKAIQKLFKNIYLINI